MKKTVKIVMDSQVRWPARCPKCGSTEHLQSAHAKIVDTKSVSPTLLGGWRVKSEMLQFAYPICADHATGAALVMMVNRISMAAQLLRVIIYGACLIDFAFLYRAIVDWRRPDLDLADPVTLTMSTTLVLLAALIWSRRWAPLRLLQYTEGVLDLRFGDAGYADAFVALNPVQTSPERARRDPWYAPRHHGKIMGIALLVFGLLVLILGPVISKLHH